jgi:hypothetical protein
MNKPIKKELSIYQEIHRMKTISRIFETLSLPSRDFVLGHLQNKRVEDLPRKPIGASK